MKFATRLNSFLPQFNNNLDDVFQELHQLGINYVDFNYPEHTQDISAAAMKQCMDKYQLKANGVALRFRKEFLNGELGNSDIMIAKKANQLCKDAIDYCRQIEGEVVTIWLGFDGFDYSFQIDYEKVWKQLKEAFTELCDYAPDMHISIEYKPYEERSYAFLDSVGTTLSMVQDVHRENLGMTLDYCHMLMKHENPAFSVSIVGSHGKLYGIHLNDGYGAFDDGLMVGSASLWRTLEFLYYVRLYDYDQAIYFDTFPKREGAVEECRQNIEMTNRLLDMIDAVGMDVIKQVISENSGIKANQLMLKFLNI